MVEEGEGRERGGREEGEGRERGGGAMVEEDHHWRDRQLQEKKRGNKQKERKGVWRGGGGETYVVRHISVEMERGGR